MSTGSFTGLSTIGQVGIGVKSIARAVAFYRDRLWIPLLFQAPPNLAFYDAGGVRLMLSPPEQPLGSARDRPEFDRPASILYFNVADIAVAHQTLSARGVEFIGAPHMIARMPGHERWMAFLRDSEGNTLALMEERR